MHLDLSRQDDASLIRLVGELTIYSAAACRQSLLDLLADLPAAAPRRLDLSGISEIDTAGLQLLLALLRPSATTAPTTVIASSPAVDRCLRLCGQAALLPPQEG